MIDADHPIAKAVGAMELSVAYWEMTDSREGIDFSLSAARMILETIEESPALHELKDRARHVLDRLIAFRDTGVAIDGDCRAIPEIPLLSRAH